MGIIDFLTGNKGVFDAALGTLKSAMKKQGYKSVAIHYDPDLPEADAFRIEFQHHPSVLVPLTDLEQYQDAMLKTLENGHSSTQENAG